MSALHAGLAAGRWFRLPFLEQVANVGSEVERALLWQERGSPDHRRRAVERALELLDLSLADGRNRGRGRELARAREVLADYFYGDNRYGSSPELLRGYFGAFARAARAGR
ncbi:MAG: hypothetical protein R6X12_05590 [bacterium]